MPEHALSWPRLERLAVAWLKTRTSALVVTRRPEELAAAVAERGGVVQVQRAGGADGPSLDKQLAAEVLVFASERGELWDLVDVIESAMFDLAGDGNAEGYVDDVVESFAFADDPHPDPSLCAATGTFTITVRPL